MDIFEYMDFIKPRMKEAYDKNDKDEFLRLISILKETLNDLEDQIKKIEIKKE